MIKDPKILAGAAVLLLALFWFVIKPHFFAAKPAPVYTEEQIAAAPRPTVLLGKTVGDTKGTAPDGLILNLKAPASSPNYVKAIIALEFNDPGHKYVGAAGAGLAAKNAAFTEELQPEMHKVLDAVTAIFGSKTVDEVSTTGGRDKLKTELIDAINAQLHTEKVEAVYFETFITQ